MTGWVNTPPSPAPKLSGRPFQSVRTHSPSLRGSARLHTNTHTIWWWCVGGAYAMLPQFGSGKAGKSSSTTLLHGSAPTLLCAWFGYPTLQVVVATLPNEQHGCRCRAHRMARRRGGVWRLCERGWRRVEGAGANTNRTRICPQSPSHNHIPPLRHQQLIPALTPSNTYTHRKVKRDTGCVERGGEQR